MAIQLVIFDLDDTLAPSKSPMVKSTAVLLLHLLNRVAVCIISGGTFAQFEHQVLPAMGESALLSRLHLMPTCGTQYYRRRSGRWHQIYAEVLDPGIKAQVVAVLADGATELGLRNPVPWGPIIEDRTTQVTFSALGQRAPAAAKAAWDPTGEKRNRLRDYVADRLPDLEVRAGGSTSIDVTARGVDKAYGVRKLQEHLHLDIDEILFLGDRLDDNGNDYPVKEMGVTTISVSGWRDTERRIAEILSTGYRTTSGATLR
jgi:HAD superfamily hydrolase (TIGR01484 family)